MTANTPLKIIFAGTPEFAAVALLELISANHNIVAVYTQPDRPSGRGRQITASAVKALALKHHLHLEQPQTLRDATAQATLKAFEADIMVVAAYGLILPLAVLTIFPLGCINIHPSLLPRWRGAAPIQRTIFSGDTETGVTIMQIEEGLDSGPMLYQEKCPVKSTDTSASLHDSLAAMGAKALLKTLNELAANKAKPIPQDANKVTHAQKLAKSEAELDWHKSATELDCKIRAFNPWPVAQTISGLNVVRVWQATVLTNDAGDKPPGYILQTSPHGIDVATGKGVLRLQQLQLPGKRAMSVAELLNAYAADFSVATILG